MNHTKCWKIAWFFHVSMPSYQVTNQFKAASVAKPALASTALLCNRDQNLSVIHVLLISFHMFGTHVLPLIFLFFDWPFCLWSLFLLYDCCFWNDFPTKDGCCLKAKLLATCPRWSFCTINIFFSSPRCAVYARTQEINAFWASLFIIGWGKMLEATYQFEAHNKRIRSIQMESKLTC